MAAFAYSAINAQGFLSDGEIHAPSVDVAREQLRIRGLLAEKLEGLLRRRRRRKNHVQEDQAEVAADLLAPVRDDDRGRPERRAALVILEQQTTTRISR